MNGREKTIYCEVIPKGEAMEIKCDVGEKKQKRMYCQIYPKIVEGGLSIAGFGLNYGKQEIKLECITDEDFKREIAHKLGTSLENIELRYNREYIK